MMASTGGTRRVEAGESVATDSAKPGSPRLAAKPSVIEAGIGLEARTENEQAAPVVLIEHEAPHVTSSQSERPTLNGIDADVRVPGARVVTDPPSAERSGGAGATVATGNPAALATPGLPPGEEAKSNEIEAGTGSEVRLANEQTARPALIGREGRLAAPAKAKQSNPTDIVADARIPGARIVTGPLSAKRDGGTCASVATCGPARPATSRLPPGTGAKLNAVEGDNARGAALDNERKASQLKVARAVTPLRMPTPGLPPRLTAPLNARGADGGIAESFQGDEELAQARRGQAVTLTEPGKSNSSLASVIDIDAGSVRARIVTDATSALRDGAAGASVATRGSASATSLTSLPRVTHPKLLVAAGTRIGADAIQEAITVGAALDLNQAREIVVAARNLLRDAHEARRTRKDTEPSSRTLEDYRKKVARVDAAVRGSDKSPADALGAALAKYAGARQTFQKMKSAVRTLTLDRVKILLSKQDKLQRLRGTVDEREWKPGWLAMVSMLRWCLSDLETLDGLNREECLRANNLVSRPSRSKRNSGSRYEEGWRDRFLHVNERSPKYRDAGVVLRFCGVRPEELERGVRVWWSPKGVRVLVPGAKVRDTAGQPWRAFLLAPAALPKWFVEQVRKNHKLKIRAEADPMRAHLGRQSQPVLNPLDRKRLRAARLSAYDFRHALVSDLRAGGWTAEDIAPAIGESAAATATLYGSAHTTGTVSPAIIAGSIRVPRAVKPLDRSGLSQVARRLESEGRIGAVTKKPARGRP